MKLHLLIIKAKEQTYNRYNKAFNFFQSKSISAIVNSRKVDHVILYRDFQFYDDETEYFKRYYANAETFNRIKKLINYYENNLSAPKPNLLLLPQYPIIENYNRKVIKLCIMKEKSLAKRASKFQTQANEHYSQQDCYLNKIDESEQSEVQSEKDNDDSSEFDSQVHDTYMDGEMVVKEKEKRFDLSQLKSIEVSQYVMEFTNESDNHCPQINILPPVSPIQIIVSPQIKQTTTVAVQTLPPQIPIINIKKAEKDKSQQIQKIKSQLRIILVPDFKKQVSPSLKESIYRSQLKNQNIILTESIQMVKKKQEQKKKPGKFMEYYNAMPVKKPTNILDHYIKKKK